MKRGPRPATRNRGKAVAIREPLRLREAMAIAAEQGLLHGERTQVVRGRMPKALVMRAKKRTGIASDTELIEVALANIAVADDYPEWLLSRRSTIDPAADLEF